MGLVKRQLPRKRLLVKAPSEQKQTYGNDLNDESLRNMGFPPACGTFKYSNRS